MAPVVKALLSETGRSAPHDLMVRFLSVTNSIDSLKFYLKLMSITAWWSLVDWKDTTKARLKNLFIALNAAVPLQPRWYLDGRPSIIPMLSGRAAWVDVGSLWKASENVG